MADADRATAHRGRDIAAVEVSHGASFFLCLELQVGLWEKKPGVRWRCREVLHPLAGGTVPLLACPGPGV